MEQCVHKKITITLFETIATVYTLDNGEVKDGEELEPNPIARFDIRCSDCDLNKSYTDISEIPEPFRQSVAFLRYSVYHEEHV